MTTRNQPLRAAVLGATGTVGQRFVTLLAEHPWFELTALAASERSAGKLYRDAVTWIQTRPIDDAVAAMPVRTIDELADHAKLPGGELDIVFSALDACVARDVEPRFARRCLVVTNASAHRMDADVPLIVPEVNPDHLSLLSPPEDGRALPAGIVANPNCSTIGLVLALKPLADAFGFERISVVTLQAEGRAGDGGRPGSLADLPRRAAGTGVAVGAGAADRLPRRRRTTADARPPGPRPGHDDLHREAAGVSDPRLPIRRPLAQHPAGRRRRGAARRRARRRPLRATGHWMTNPVRAFAPASVSNKKSFV